MSLEVRAVIDTGLLILILAILVLRGSSMGVVKAKARAKSAVIKPGAPDCEQKYPIPDKAPRAALARIDQAKPPERRPRGPGPGTGERRPEERRNERDRATR